MQSIQHLSKHRFHAATPSSAIRTGSGRFGRFLRATGRSLGTLAEVAGSVTSGASLIKLLFAGFSAVRGADQGGLNCGEMSSSISELADSDGSDRSIMLLKLQQRMQQESEIYATISNVLRSRHEAAMSVIRNLHA